MALPKVTAERLKKAIDVANIGSKFKTIEELCSKIARSNWADENDLDVNVIKLLMEHHKIEFVPAEPEPIQVSEPPKVIKQRRKKPIEVDDGIDEELLPQNRRPKAEISAAQVPVSFRGGMRTTIAIPSGDCPIKLKATDLVSVRSWAEQLRNNAEARSELLTLTALRHYARLCYDFNSEEFRTVRSHLIDLYQHEGI